MLKNQNRLLPLVLCLLIIGIYYSYANAQESSTAPDEPITESTEVNTETTAIEQPAANDDDGAKNSIDFDIDELIARMKETDAIGTITKLSLKNQVDDLLETAEEIKSKKHQEVVEKRIKLRENFEGLILKTVTLLNKGKDYALAEDIYQAREELWTSIMENKA